MELKNTAINYYAKIKEKTRLRNAWFKVYDNGIKSKSRETRIAIKEFDKKASQNLENIYRHLLKGKFKFSPAKGIPIPRPGKKSRPIVIAPIRNRVVQRSILDVLQEEPKIQQFFLTETSFGGIKDYENERSVKTAVKAAYEAMRNGAIWYIKSDIHDFFTKIPKDKVLKTIANVIQDKEFNNLLKAAVNVELENLADLGGKKNLFPIYDIGVAQGCCLSPLIGNILLNDFDKTLNGRGITCLRYIDDFIILGPTQRHVKVAFKSAKKIMSDLGFNIYDPSQEKGKADSGATDKGYEFLGCEILPGFIRPSLKSRQRLLSKIEVILQESIQYMSSPETLFSKNLTLVDTLSDVSNVIMGWGNQYSFCNDSETMRQLDYKINLLLKEYFVAYNKAKNLFNKEPSTIRRLLGVHLLSDCKQIPII